MHGTECEFAPPPLRFERRRSDRCGVSGSAVAVFHRPCRAPLLSSVRLADASLGGLGVYSENEIKPGTSFRLYPDDPSQPRRAGRVVGCVRVGKVFRLGLQFQQAIAA